MTEKEVHKICNALEKMMRPQLDEMRGDIATVYSRLSTIEKHYTQFGTPHRQNIQKAIDEHQRMIDALTQSLEQTQ